MTIGYSLTLHPPSAIHAACAGMFRGARVHEFVLVTGTHLSLYEIASPTPQKDASTPVSPRFSSLGSTYLWGHTLAIRPVPLAHNNSKDALLVLMDGGCVALWEYTESHIPYSDDSSGAGREDHVGVSFLPLRPPCLGDPSARSAGLRLLHRLNFGPAGLRRDTPGRYVGVDARGGCVSLAALDGTKLFFPTQISTLSSEHDPRERGTEHGAFSSDFEGTPKSARSLTLGSPIESLPRSPGTLTLAYVPLEHETDAQQCVYAGLERASLPHGDAGSKTSPPHLVVYIYDRSCAVVTVREVTRVEPGSHLLFPVPYTPLRVAPTPGHRPPHTGCPGGVLVCSPNHLRYVEVTTGRSLHAALPRRHTLPVEHTVMVCAGALMRTREGFFYLLQSEYGDLYKVTLTVSHPPSVPAGEGDGGSGGVVTALHVRYFDTIPLATYLYITRRGGLVALGEVANHRLYQFQSLGIDHDRYLLGHLVVREKAEEGGANRGGIQNLPVFAPHSLRNLRLCEELSNTSPLLGCVGLNPPEVRSGRELTLLGWGGRGLQAAAHAFTPGSAPSRLLLHLPLTSFESFPPPHEYPYGTHHPANTLPLSLITTSERSAALNEFFSPLSAPPCVLLRYPNATHPFTLFSFSSMKDNTNPVAARLHALPSPHDGGESNNTAAVVFMAYLADGSQVRVHPNLVRHHLPGGHVRHWRPSAIHGAPEGSNPSMGSYSSSDSSDPVDSKGLISHAASTHFQLVTGLGPVVEYFALDEAGVLRNANRLELSGSVRGLDVIHSPEMVSAEVTGSSSPSSIGQRKPFSFMAVATDRRELWVVEIPLPRNMRQSSTARGLEVRATLQCAVEIASVVLAWQPVGEVEISESSDAAELATSDSSPTRLFLYLGLHNGTVEVRELGIQPLQESTSSVHLSLAIRHSVTFHAPIVRVVSETGPVRVKKLFWRCTSQTTPIIDSASPSPVGLVHQFFAIALQSESGLRLTGVYLMEKQESLSASATAPPVDGIPKYYGDPTQFHTVLHEPVIESCAWEADPNAHTLRLLTVSRTGALQLRELTTLWETTRLSSPGSFRSSFASSPLHTPLLTPKLPLGATPRQLVLLPQQCRYAAVIETDPHTLNTEERQKYRAGVAQQRVATGESENEMMSNSSSNPSASLALEENREYGVGFRGSARQCVSYLRLVDVHSLGSLTRAGANLSSLPHDLAAQNVEAGNAVALQGLIPDSGSPNFGTDSRRHGTISEIPPVTVDLMELDGDLAAVSLCCFSSGETDYVVVGAASASALFSEPLGVTSSASSAGNGATDSGRDTMPGTLLVFEIVPPALGTGTPASAGPSPSSSSSPTAPTLRLAHKTPLPGIPFTLCEFGPRVGKLLVGVHTTLQLYALGKRKMLLKCERRGFPTRVTRVASLSRRVFVADAAESVFFVHYTPSANLLSVFAEDTLPRAITALTVLDYHTVAVADRYGGLTTLRVPRHVREDVSEESIARGSETAVRVADSTLSSSSSSTGVMNKTTTPELAAALLQQSTRTRPQQVEVLTQWYVGDVVTSLSTLSSLGEGGIRGDIPQPGERAGSSTTGLSSGTTPVSGSSGSASVPSLSSPSPALVYTTLGGAIGTVQPLLTDVEATLLTRLENALHTHGQLPRNPFDYTAEGGATGFEPESATTPRLPQYGLGLAGGRRPPRATQLSRGFWEPNPRDYSLGGTDHNAYRSYYLPRKGIVDGDFVEAVWGSLSQPSRREIATLLQSSVGEIENVLRGYRSGFGG